MNKAKKYLENRVEYMIQITISIKPVVEKQAPSKKNRSLRLLLLHHKSSIALFVERLDTKALNVF